jgi:hypothetical protein
MRKPSQYHSDIQANIETAKDSLRAMSRMLSDWREFNQAATERVATASKWDTDERKKPRNHQPAQLS